MSFNRDKTLFGIKHIAILVVMLVVWFPIQAQTGWTASANKKAQKSFEKARGYYQSQQWDDAVKSLQKSIEYDSLFAGAWLLMGDLMQQEKNIDLAFKSYEKAVSIDSVAFPNVYFTLGKLAFDLSEYALSRDFFQEYLDRANLDSAGFALVNAARQRSVEALNIVSHPLPVSFCNGGPDLNTPSDEFVNFINAEENKLIMTRKTKRTELNSEKPVFEERFFVALRQDSLWKASGLLNIPWLEGNNVGGMSMSADGRSMLFTGCYWPKGQGSCDLYYSNRVGDEWLYPTSFSRRINTSGWESQPVISSDGKVIYFSSKRPGGRGGADIWKSVYLDGKGWSPPVNLGDSINTEGDEMAPFIHGDGRTLYFSSNGHAGLGGFDLFVARMDFTDQWGQVTNLGLPANSPADDINIFVGLEGKQGWISSNREGTLGGMDIWRLEMPELLAPQEVLLLGGRVLDSLSRTPLGAEIEVVELPDGIEKRLLHSDSLTGEFLVVLQSEKSYLFNISKPGYLFYSEQVILDKDSITDYVEKEYLLQPISSGVSMNLHHILFDFNSDSLLPTSYIELGKLLRFLKSNPLVQVEIVGHTDHVGTPDFNQRLSERRAHSVLSYLIDSGISPARLTSRGKGDTFPIASNENESGCAKNRRTEIIVQ